MSAIWSASRGRTLRGGAAASSRAANPATP
jgi:hypothetical protein